jgi:DNA repair exonuclease SbcCD ATPase subunit
MKSNLAIVAKDSKSLSPTRASLANLLHQAELLRREVEPLATNLARCDEVQVRADRALDRRDRLLEEHDRAVADAIVFGQPRPDSMLVDDAEIELRAAQTDARAVTRERDRLSTELQSANERGGAIQRQVAAVIAQILVEEAIAIAKTGFTEAFKLMRRHEALVTAVHEHLRATGEMAFLFIRVPPCKTPPGLAAVLSRHSPDPA